MNRELFDKRNKLTADLRKELDAWEVETRSSTNNFDAEANGVWKEKVGRIEAELDKVEAEISIAQTRSKVAKNDQETLFDTRGIGGKTTDGDAEYNKRFTEAVFSGNRVALDRVMSERTNVTTGATNSISAIPTEWQDRIVEKINQFNIMRQICPVRSVGANQKIVVGGALPTAYKVAEAGTITDDTTFAVANVDVGHLTYACYVPVSKQYSNDAIGGLDYVARKAGEAIGNLVENEYTNGAAGAGNMPGLFSYTLPTLDTGGTLQNWRDNSGGSSTDDLIDLQHLLAPQYRQRGVFMMNDAIAKIVRKFKTTVGEYIWKLPERYSDMRDGMPSTLLGSPVYINQTMASTPVDGDIFVTFFDPSYYEIYDRDGGVDVMIDPYGLSTSLMNRLVVSLRTYGVLTNTSAAATLTL